MENLSPCAVPNKHTEVPGCSDNCQRSPPNPSFTVYVPFLLSCDTPSQSFRTQAPQDMAEYRVLWSYAKEQYSYVIQKIYFQFFQNSLLIYRMVRSACNPRNGQRERLAVHIMGQPIYNHQILPLLKLLSDEHLHGTQLSSHLLPIIYPQTPSINVFLTNFPIMVFASPLQSSQPIGYSSWFYKSSHI